MKIFIISMTAVLLFILVGCSANSETSEDTPIYIANAGEGTISVIDIKNNEEIEKIDIGSEQASHGIALSSDGQTVYTGTGFDGKSLLVIDTKTKETIKKIEFNQGVHGIDISPDGKSLFISLNPGLGENGGSLTIIDTETLELITEVETEDGPAHVAVTASGKQVWVANVNDNSVSVIDTDSKQLVKTIEVGQVPNEVAITPDEKYVYVANVESDLISVIDISKLEVIKTIEAGDGPHGVTVSPDGTELWVANNNSNDLYVIDTATLATKTIIPTGSYANHVGFSLDGNLVFVTNRKSNDLVKIDRKTKEVIARIPVGSEPHEISLEDNVIKSKERVNYKFNDSLTIEENNIKHSIGQTVNSIEVNISHIENEADINDFEANLNENIVVRLALTTHSGNISELDLESNIFLVDANGNRFKPENWLVESKDAHHPSYVAVFPKVDSSYFLLIEDFQGQNVELDFTSI